METLLSIIIAAVSLTVIIQSLTSSLRALSYIKDFTTAVILVDNKMFDLINKSFIQKDLNEEGSFPFPYDKFRYKVQAQDGNLHQVIVKKTTQKNVRVTTEATAEDHTNLLNKVKLTIQWPVGQKERSLSVETYLLSFSEEEKAD